MADPEIDLRSAGSVLLGLMPEAGKSVEVRLALLEARVRVLILAVEGMIVAFVTALIAYFFGAR